MNRKPDNYLSREYLRPTVGSIVDVQLADGSIPWFQDGITDTWTHVESAMAMDVGNCHSEAQRAYEWLSEIQLNDGSWYASYKDGQPLEMHKVSHSVSYIAVGVWHHYHRSNAFQIL